MGSIIATLRSWFASGRLAHERALVVSLAIAVVILRSSAFVFGRAPHFDSDQAIVGLMAKHLSEFRALPVFFYGQQYMLGVEAWLAAPLFHVFGPSVTALKLPILGIHLAVTVLLLVVLERELGIRPLLALVPTLFFLVPPVGTTSLMLQANGGNVEPFLYVLLLWTLRRRPLPFGVVLGVGFLNREFTAYGLGALLLLETGDGTLFRNRNLQGKAISLVSLAAVVQGVEVLRSVGNPFGPGTSAASFAMPSNLEQLARRSCWMWSEVPGWLGSMLTSNLSTLYTGGADWLWLLTGGAAIAAGIRVVPALLSGGSVFRSRLQFPTYLLLVGLIAAAVPAVARCGAVLDRYMLLALLGLVGVTAIYLKAERRSGLRAAFIGVILACTLFNAAAHSRYAFDYYSSPDPRLALADHLVSNDVRFAVSDYWTAYYLTFLTDEQVIVASSDVVRIREYQEVVAEHGDEAVRIGLAPCRDGHEVSDFHVCPPSQ
ncbi:MAG: hypothetical protein OXG04_05155 [Acidobacteria bacterium]|nr:hypothetical protein [Acidobacteriota bacterium]